MNFCTRTTNSILVAKRIGRCYQQLRRLNLQEYQSKQLLRQNGCTVQNFFIVDEDKKDGAAQQFRNSAYDEYVVKAQILAGGRGKGFFIGGHRDLGGVYITKSQDEASSSANEMLGKRLVTKQTKPEGVLVKKVMIAESVTIKRETYLSILMDPTSLGPVVVACPIGGMDIEEIAAKQPELILKERISVTKGISGEQCRRIAEFLKFTGKTLEDAAEQIRRLFELFLKVDATQIEINPFAETDDGRVFCIDAKLNFDDCASFRQKEIFAMDTFEEMDSGEIRAKKCGLSYIGLDGNIACLVNGAGLAMATMDIIKLHGGEPANFLDVGGSASAEQVKEAFKIITSDKRQINAIFINIFGGIMRCDVIARGILDACAELKLLHIPVVIRLKGTRVMEAKKMLEEASHVGTFELCDSFEDAARKAVQLAGRSNKNTVRSQTAAEPEKNCCARAGI